MGISIRHADVDIDASAAGHTVTLLLRKWVQSVRGYRRHDDTVVMMSKKEAQAIADLMQKVANEAKE